MNGKKMSGEITGKGISVKKTTGTNMNNASEITGANTTGNSTKAQVLPAHAAQVDRVGSGKKRFPIFWLLPVAAWSFFFGYFWSYIPVFRGIVSLFVFSRFLAGLWGTHFLL